MQLDQFWKTKINVLIKVAYINIHGMNEDLTVSNVFQTPGHPMLAVSILLPISHSLDCRMAWLGDKEQAR